LRGASFNPFIREDAHDQLLPLQFKQKIKHLQEGEEEGLVAKLLSKQPPSQIKTRGPALLTYRESVLGI